VLYKIISWKKRIEFSFFSLVSEIASSSRLAIWQFRFLAKIYKQILIQNLYEYDIPVFFYIRIQNSVR